MMKNLIFVLVISVSFKALCQKEVNIVYDTNIEYKNFNPDYSKLDFNKGALKELVTIIASKSISDDEIDSISTLIWQAAIDPILFDSNYKEFSEGSLGSGYSVRKDGAHVKEPKPFLAEWSVQNSEITYIRFVIEFILSHFNLICYGDNFEGVQAAFYQIIQTRELTIENYSGNKWVYDYLDQINQITLKEINKRALVSKGYYTIFVSNIEDSERLIELLARIKYDLVIPKAR
ncbi:hypothetical protein BFP72_11195 [Reichenbachiella sp. 5M10]|uniref:hypothetical protein n=1 Tax=Reichenbachiella sp. 5M10 TaxID=1889772 RepID=UPI000C15C759|nr:hypothetical protein [Reichenbachiella sp. 5M10]PIB35917.1 hypothetical protein BFP72_11195 [Reichenbachiella sp. 5M10]